ncbi:MAG TPA: MerR family DNA-binding protein [Holophagaceae bacterium]|jgi:DNA-binding transcriptional MerR regulator|nr:MerR family DNA-binding protein [Holophagaceae bacterium]
MADQGPMKMADLTRACEVSDQAVRLYEREGLLKPVSRTPKGYRLFDGQAIATIHFIKQAQRCGFTLAEIRGLLTANLASPKACETTKSLLDQKLEHVEAQLADLRIIQEILISLRGACEGQPGPACPAFIRLSAPAAVPKRKSR